MADFRSALEILLKAKDETRAATSSAAANFSTLSQKITAVSTAFTAIRQAGEDAIRIVDALIGSAVRQAAGFNELATRIGASAEALSEFAFAARVVGIETTQLTQGMQSLTRRLGEVAETGGGPAVEALESLGININEIIGLRADQQFEVIVDALGDVEGAAQRAAIATKLFGEQGVALIPLIGRMDELRETARTTGAAMDQNFIDRAVKAREAFVRFEAAIEGVRNRLVDEILIRIDEEDLQSALKAVTELASFAGRVIDITITIAENIADFRKKLEEMGFRFGTVGADPELDAIIRARVEEVDLGRLAEKEAIELELKLRNRDEIIAELERLQSLSPLNIDMTVGDPEVIAAVQAGLADLVSDADKFTTEMQESAEAVDLLTARQQGFNTEYARLMGLVSQTTGALDAQTLAAGQIAGHWDEIAAAADKAQLSQLAIARQIEVLVAGGMSIAEAWDTVAARLGVAEESVRGLIESTGEAVPVVLEAQAAFDLFATSAHDMTQRLSESLIQIEENLGIVVTDMIARSLDHLSTLLAQTLVYGGKFGEAFKKIFQSLASEIIAQMIRIAAAKIALGLLGLFAAPFTGGASLALTATAAGASGAPIEQAPRTFRPPGEEEVEEPIRFPEMTLEIPPPIVMAPEVRLIEPDPVRFPEMALQVPTPAVVPPEIEFLEPAAVTFPAMALEVPAPSVVPPEIVFLTPAPVTFPEMVLQVPRPDVVAPEVQFLEAESIRFPELRLEVPRPEIQPPEIQFAEPEPISFPAMALSVPVPEVERPEIRFLEPDPITFPKIELAVPDPVILPPVEVQIPAPRIPEPKVSILQPPLLPIPETVIAPPAAPITAPPTRTEPEIQRSAVFNITVNTGFSSRGVGLETARQLIPFLREAGGF